jgi:hypothetical protein
MLLSADVEINRLTPSQRQRPIGQTNGDRKIRIWRSRSAYFCPHFSVLRFPRHSTRIRRDLSVSSVKSVVFYFDFCQSVEIREICRRLLFGKCRVFRVFRGAPVLIHFSAPDCSAFDFAKREKRIFPTDSRAIPRMTTESSRFRCLATYPWYCSAIRGDPIVL